MSLPTKINVKWNELNRHTPPKLVAVYDLDNRELKTVTAYVNYYDGSNWRNTPLLQDKDSLVGLNFDNFAVNWQQSNSQADLPMIVINELAGVAGKNPRSIQKSFDGHDWNQIPAVSNSTGAESVFWDGNVPHIVSFAQNSNDNYHSVNYYNGSSWQRISQTEHMPDHLAVSWSSNGVPQQILFPTETQLRLGVYSK